MYNNDVSWQWVSPLLGREVRLNTRSVFPQFLEKPLGGNWGGGGYIVGLIQEVLHSFSVLYHVVGLACPPHCAV